MRPSKLLILALALTACLSPLNSQIIYNSDSNESTVYVDKDLTGLSELIQKDKLSKDVFQFFSHGRSGELLIDNKWMNPQELASFLKENVLNDTIKHLNIYGCNFAEGEKGLSAVAYLEEELGISIAASTNVTGKGGDWNLEVNSNQYSSLELSDYQGSLQRTCPGGSVTVTAPSLSFSNPVAESPLTADPSAPVFGDVFRFTAVATGIDVLVEIIDNGSGAAGLNELDIEAFGVIPAIQPHLNSNGAGDRSVDLLFSFVLTGTTTPVQASFYASGIDIDGFGGGNQEYVEVDNPEFYFFNNPTVLSRTVGALSGGNSTRFQNNDGVGIADIGTNPNAAFTAY